MSKQENDILKILYQKPFINKQTLAKILGYSVSIINRSLKNLKEKGYLDKNFNLTDLAKEEFLEKAPKRAIILAAGFGMRMVPINMEIPKALLKVNGEVMIERQIRQLHEVGVTEIYVVVGFMKEQFEYLIDDFGVELIVNPKYAISDNLYSMKLAVTHLSNAYVIPCNIWCNKNPFNKNELYSWYMLSNNLDENSKFTINSKMKITKVSNSKPGNSMLGISYFLEEDAKIIRDNILYLCGDPKNKNIFWEKAIYYRNNKLPVAKLVDCCEVIEINTYEDLRNLDSKSEHLQSQAINTISNELGVLPEEISEITVLKKGMTNRSFLFSVGKEKYIMRIPGEGTDRLINRKEETDVYKVINGKNLSDEIIYINSENGYKITKYIKNTRACNPFCRDDVIKCMKLLKDFHNMNLRVEHYFDIFKQIEFYEDLWNGKQSIYRDYAVTKKNVFKLQKYIESHSYKNTLTHIDAVPDNFLFSKNSNGEEEIHLIDWEYAGMQDPHVDIAMFCIYSLYDKRHVDSLIDIYFENHCTPEVRIKIYCYIAACGLLWSNWCEYKHQIGIEFGEYSLRQYRYAKEYYRFAVNAIKEAGEKN